MLTHTRHVSRCFSNRLPDYSAGGGPELDRKVLMKQLRLTLEYVLSRTSSSPYIYTGSTGVAYMLYHVGRRHPDVCTEINLSEHCLETALRLTSSVKAANSEHSHAISLLSGHAGLLVVSALVHDWASHVVKGSAVHAYQSKCQSAIADFCALYKDAMSSAAEDEILYGRAGYLLGGLILNRWISPAAVPQTVLDSVAVALLKAGQQNAASNRTESPLYYEWPRGSQPKPYLGAAHGLMGILYVLLHFPIATSSSNMGIIRDTLLFVLSLESDSEGRAGQGGAYPTRADHEQGHKLLVHWCHGAPGAVFLFCKAYQVYGDEKYREAAERAGETVWAQGLLRKGPGLCHGVAGNAYALLALHKALGGAYWLHRALEFARFMGTDKFKSESSVPDHPRSLFEGYAGAACLLADLLGDDPAGARFPLFEV